MTSEKKEKLKQLSLSVYVTSEQGDKVRNILFGCVQMPTLIRSLMFVNNSVMFFLLTNKKQTGRQVEYWEGGRGRESMTMKLCAN